MKIATLLAVGVLLAGCSSAAKAPATTVTSTATQSATPKSCQDALDDADKLIGYAQDVIEAAGAGMDAYTSADITGLQAQTAKLNKLRPKVEAARAAYEEDSLVCRATPQ